MKPDFEEEKFLWEQGIKFVAGLDEAGRGPLAGPVIAAAVAVKNFNIDKELDLVKDSKQLTEKQREKLFDILTNHPQIEWGVAAVSEKIIDKINILQATKLAMQTALEKLQSKIKGGEIGYLLLDGNFKIKSAIPQKSIVKGDCKVFSISAASIIAKVTRDKMMEDYDKEFPEYGFKKHKGYPTKSHRDILKKIGFCEIHRKTFRAK